MKKKLALVLAAAMLSSAVLSGCGGNDSKPDGGEGQEAQTGEEGNHLVVEVGPDPETIDPALNSASDGNIMIIHLFEPLLNMDKDNNIIGDLGRFRGRSDLHLPSAGGPEVERWNAAHSQ